MGFRQLLQSLRIITEAKDTSIRTPAQEIEKPSPKLSSSSSVSVSSRQHALLLYGPKQPYNEVLDHPVPSILDDRELLVRNRVIGLNPIDWKAPDFNFGIPQIPYISGRDFVGEVVTSPKHESRLRPGDSVIVISTDYRDLRKAAYQEVVVATDFNVCRLPPNISSEAGSALGVAFVAAALSLGICAGLDFTKIANGPDLLSIVRRLNPQRLPEDVRSECMIGINRSERAKQGDWLAIWGGSSTTAFMSNQIARLLGLRTISILDCRKHALHLSSNPKIRPDIVVDNHSPARAIEIVRSVTADSLRFAIDTVGKDTSTQLMQCLQHGQPGSMKASKIAPTLETGLASAHLIGLTGLPKTTASANINFHTVPIKIFHEIPEVGEALMLWLERLLSQGLLVPPTILGVRDGFGAINEALDSMRRGEVSGGRIVVRLP